MSNHRAAILKMQNVSKVAARKRLINTSSHTHTPAVHLPSTTSHCADWLSVATREMRILLSGFPTSFLCFFLLKDFNNHNRISLHKSKLLKMKALNDTKEQTHEKRSTEGETKASLNARVLSWDGKSTGRAFHSVWASKAQSPAFSRARGTTRSEDLPVL